MTSTIPDIDSSGWAVDPRKYGMSAGEYIQAESRAFFADFLSRAAINEFFHFTTLTKASDHWVVSPNLDTIYSLVIVNARKGFTLILPEVKDRFISTQIITEDHLTPFYIYGGGKHEFSAKDFSTDFVAVGIRMGTNGMPDDVKTVVEKLQPHYAIEGAAPESDLTPVDMPVLEKVRAALMPAYSKLPNTFGAMQKKAADVSDWEYFTYATAGAWGLSADENAMYALDGPADAKGGEGYVATFPKVPAEAFFSITAYGPQKHLMTDSDNVVSTIKPGPDAAKGKSAQLTLPKPPLKFDKGAFFSVTTYGPDSWIKTKNFALNNRRAEANPDGSVTFRFNCPGKPNNIDTVNDWLMFVRLYQAESVQQIVDYMKLIQTTAKIEPCG